MSASQSSDSSPTGYLDTGPLEYLAFTLGKEEYGIDIQKVQELRGYVAPTRIANAPDFIKGVVNLRGIVVPILDMRIKFNLGLPSYDEFTVVVVLSLRGRTIGMVVDSVSDVITLAPDQIRPAPELGGALDVSYIVGLAALDERMVILADIDKLMSSAEIGLLDDVGPG
jgi:purine-binding chemotaxis protein CheW